MHLCTQGKDRKKKEFSRLLLRMLAPSPGQKSATLSQQVQITDSGDMLGDKFGKYSRKKSENFK